LAHGRRRCGGNENLEKVRELQGKAELLDRMVREESDVGWDYKVALRS